MRKDIVNFIAIRFERLPKIKILNDSNIYNHFQCQKVTKFERISKNLYDCTKNTIDTCALRNNQLFYTV